MAEKGLVTKGLNGATVPQCKGDMRIRLSLANVRFQFLFFAGMGNSPETHVTTLFDYR